MWEELRKFGLGPCDLPTMVSNVALMLRLVAINVDPRDNDDISAFSWTVTVVTGVSLFYEYVVSMIWFVFALSPADRDPLCAVLVFSRSLLAVLGLVRLICVRVYQNPIRQILAEYLLCDTRVVPGSRFADNLAKTLRVVKRRAVGYSVGIMLNSFIYNVFYNILRNLVKSGRHHSENCFVFYGFESMFETPYYEVAFAVQVASSFLVCYGVVFPTALFVVVNGYTEAQMVALAEEISSLWDDTHEEYEKKIKADINLENQSFSTNTDCTDRGNFINKRLKNGLISVIDIQKTHIDLIRRVEIVMSSAIAIEFVLVGISITACLLGGLENTTLLGGLENTFITLPSSLIFIGVGCFLGQSVMQAAEVFEMSVYDSKWENFDVSNKKIVLLMLLNAQRSMKLSAGSIATLSYVCFMAMIRLIYAGYTTLYSAM